MILFRRAMMTYRFAAIGQASDVGCLRDHNEDALRVNEGAGLLVVADGMGGHAAGEVASRITVDTLESEVVGHDADLGDALYRAHRNVLDAAVDGRGAPGMGTTCVACRLRDDRLEVGWVGDSRVYRYHAGGLEPLTRDHSYVQSLVDAGMLAAEKVESHPDRHILARCIGGDIDRREIDEVRVDVASGDRVLLCSDGLTGELSEAWIAGILSVYPDDQAAVDELVRSSLAAGGRDNVTVIVATVA